MSDYIVNFLEQYAFGYKKDLIDNKEWNTSENNITNAEEKIELIASVWSEHLYYTLMSFNRMCCVGCQQNDSNQIAHKCVTPEVFYSRLIHSLDDAICRVSTSEVWHDVNCRYAGEEHIPYYTCSWRDSSTAWRSYIKSLVEMIYWSKSNQKNSNRELGGLGNISINYADPDADNQSEYTMDTLDTMF